MPVSLKSATRRVYAPSETAAAVTSRSGVCASSDMSAAPWYGVPTFERRTADDLTRYGWIGPGVPRVTKVTNSPLPILPTSLVGSYAQPDWLIDRAKLAGRFPPRVRAKELWRVEPEYLAQAQDDATLLAIRAQEEAG